jgi:hypothetical protein
MESRKDKSISVGIERQKNNPKGGLFIMLKTSGCTYFIFFIYLRMQILSKHTNLSIRVEKSKSLSNNLLIDSKKLGTE